MSRRDDLQSALASVLSVHNELGSPTKRARTSTASWTPTAMPLATVQTFPVPASASAPVPAPAPVSGASHHSPPRQKAPYRSAAISGPIAHSAQPAQSAINRARFGVSAAFANANALLSASHAKIPAFQPDLHSVGAPSSPFRSKGFTFLGLVNQSQQASATAPTGTLTANTTDAEDTFTSPMSITQRRKTKKNTTSRMAVVNTPIAEAEPQQSTHEDTANNESATTASGNINLSPVDSLSPHSKLNKSLKQHRDEHSCVFPDCVLPAVVRCKMCGPTARYCQPHSTWIHSLLESHHTSALHDERARTTSTPAAPVVVPVAPQVSANITVRGPPVAVRGPPIGPPVGALQGPPIGPPVGPPTVVASGPPVSISAGPPIAARGPPVPTSSGPPVPMSSGPPVPMSGGPPVPVFGGPPPSGPPVAVAASAPPSLVSSATSVSNLPTLRAFHWNTLPASVSESSAFWQRVHQHDMMPLDVTELEAQFSSAAPSSRQSINALAPKPTTSTIVHLLEGKRVNAIEIALSRFKTAPDNIKAALFACDESFLTLDRVQQLIGMLPTKDEYDLVVSFDWHVTSLGTAEKFVLAVGSIPRVEQRLAAMQLKLSFDGVCEEWEAELALVENAVAAVHNSSALVGVTGAILQLGNCLNRGHPQRGNVAAFKLSTLTKVANTKTSDGKRTALDVIAMHLSRHHAAWCSSLVDELALCERAARIETQHTTAQVQSLLRGVLSIATEIAHTADSPNDHFNTNMSAFHTRADVRAQAMRVRLDSCLKQAKQLARGLGEAIDEHAFKWDDMLRLLGEFGRQFAAAHKAAAAVLLNEKKSALVSDKESTLPKLGGAIKRKLRSSLDGSDQ